MQAVAVKSQLRQIARAMYGSPPIHGVLLVSTILGDPDTKALWVEELRVASYSSSVIVLIQQFSHFVLSFCR